MLIFILFVILILSLYYFIGNKIIIYLPVIIFFAEIIYPLVYGTSNELSSSQIKLIYFTYLFTILVFFNILYTYKYLLNIYVLTPVMFLIIALLNSSETWEGVKQVIRISVPLLAFPSYYVYFKKNEGIEVFFKKIILFVIFFILLIIISSILRYGNYWSYGERTIGGIYFFGFNLWELYSLSYAVMFLYFLKDNYRLNKVLVEVLFFTTLVILLLLYKRGLLIPMVLTLVFYYLYNIKKLNLTKITIGIVMAFVFISSFLSQILVSVNKRESTLHFSSYAEEGRTTELIVYFDHYIKTLDFIEILIGQDFFNSGDKFQFMEDVLSDDGRILHSDLANLLYTTGVLGTLFFYVYFVFLYKKYKSIKNYISPLLRYMFFAFFVSFILKQTVEGLNNPINYFIPLSIIGSILGFSNKIVNKIKV